MVFLLTSIIPNFKRRRKGIGNFVNSDFEKNGWYVIDATSLMDALTKLSSYLGDSQADNVYINSHGLMSVRFDDLFGQSISSIAKSRDIFVNRDYSSNYSIKGQNIILFQNFINYNQTSHENYLKGWVQYRNGIIIQQNFNIRMTKYGVKTIK